MPSEENYLPWPPLEAEPCPLDAEDAELPELEPADAAGAADAADARAAETALAGDAVVPAIGVDVVRTPPLGA